MKTTTLKYNYELRTGDITADASDYTCTYNDYKKIQAVVETFNLLMITDSIKLTLSDKNSFNKGTFIVEHGICYGYQFEQLSVILKTIERFLTLKLAEEETAESILDL